jgi:hypothetical protein
LDLTAEDLEYRDSDGGQGEKKKAIEHVKDLTGRLHESVLKEKGGSRVEGRLSPVGLAPRS